MQRYVMEFIGTMFLVLAIAFTGNPLAIGVMLIALVYLGGHVSGAHYNPAVSLGVWMRGKLDVRDLAPYIVAQVLGALAAAAIYSWVKGQGFVPAPGSGVAFEKALLIEILFTFLLVSVILNVATTRKLEGNYIYGLAIGLTLMAGAFCGARFSGAVYNPAVAVGPMIWKAFQGEVNFSHLLLYLIGPFLGGALSALVFKYLNPEES